MSISCPRVIKFSLVSLGQALDQRDRICSLSDVQVNTGLRDAPLFVESHTPIKWASMVSKALV